MNRFTLACVTILLTMAVSNACDAQSMFQHRQPSHINMFADLQARRVGDLLTIVIRENTEVDNKDERKGNKNTDIGGIFKFSGSTSGNGGTNSAAANFDSNTTSKRIFNGKSEYSVESALQDRITVQVLDVLPNGDLVVGGKRRRSVSGETKTLVASGVVRPFDIRSDNTVASPSVANFEFAYHGKGPESSFSNQGWLGRITNKIWPF
jgi:flagellar L-ring protein precursor FlgH